MAYARIGIDQVVFCTKGTMLTTPTKVIPGGLRGKTNLVIKDVGNTDESRERFMRRGRLFTIEEVPLYQPNLLNLMDIITQYLPDGGADCELKARPQSSGVDGGCFQFSGAGSTNQHLGVAFKYECSKNKRALSIKAMVQLLPDAAKTLVDASDSNTPAVFSSVTDAGIDFTKRRNPWLNATALPFTYADLADYSFVLESVKDDENDLEEREISQMVRATVTYKFRSATIANIVTEMAYAEGLSLTFQQDTAAATFEKFVFNTNVLTQENEVRIGDSERNVTLKFTGLIPTGNISASYTAPNGGGTSADGTEGGTITCAN